MRRACTCEYPDGEHEDKPINDAIGALIAAEWKLLSTPAKGIVEVQERAVVVQHLFNEEASSGTPSDNRHRVMLDLLIAEIIALSE